MLPEGSARLRTFARAEGHVPRPPARARREISPPVPRGRRATNRDERLLRGEGFAVGDGWFHLIDRLSTKLAIDPDLVAVQVKEKFGALRFYISGRSNLRPELRAAIGKAAAASQRTCEVCGKRGKLAARRRGWLSVRCEPCNRLDIMEEACRHLADLSRGLSLARFRKDEIRVGAAKYEIFHLGLAAGYQSPQRRALLPGVDWERLKCLRSAIAVNRWTPAQVWNFMKDEVRAIGRALK